jgi:hypothetical protein
MLQNRTAVNDVWKPSIRVPISTTPRWITTYHALILYWTGADKKTLQVKIFLLTEGEDYMAFCQATEGEKAPPLPHV